MECNHENDQTKIVVPNINQVFKRNEHAVINTSKKNNTEKSTLLYCFLFAHK